MARLSSQSARGARHSRRISCAPRVFVATAVATSVALLAAVQWPADGLQLFAHHSPEALALTSVRGPASVAAAQVAGRLAVPAASVVRRPAVTRFGAGKQSQKAQKARKEGQKRFESSASAGKTKENAIEMDGIVTLHSRNMWKVELTNGVEVKCTLAGKLRQNSIKVLEGDKVKVEMSPYDLTSGRITFRTIDSKLLETEQEKKARLKAEAKEKRKQEKKDAAAA